MRKTNRAFHLHMIDTTVHIVVLWYIFRYVEGQSRWFYVMIGVFLFSYLILAILSIVGMLLPDAERTNK